MKIIFAGTPHFAAAALEALINAGHDIVSVLTQPDRPAGRGMKLVASAVKQMALQHQLAVLQPQSLKKNQVVHEQLQALDADVMVVAAYGLILPQHILDTPRLGCLNIHASLLPRWRGAAPIQRAILAGDKETGITIMQMDAGLDTGDMLLTRELTIVSDETSQSLHDRLCVLGAESIVEALDLLSQGKLEPVVQDDTQACYAAKINKAEAEIDWRLSAVDIHRVVRTFNPSPGAYTFLQGQLVKIWQAQLIEMPLNQEVVHQPGEIIAIERDGIVVSCGDGLLRLEVIQKAGGKRLSAEHFLAGNALQLGGCFESKKPVDSRDD